MIRAALLAVAVTLLLAAPAPAAVIGVDGDHLTYTAEPGEVNDLRLTFYPTEGALLFDDRVAIRWDGSDVCQAAGDSTQVVCSIGVGATVLDLGDGDDWLEGSDASEIVQGGPGSDDLRGDGGDDVIDGGPGDDALEKGSPASRAGNDLVVGGEGNDTAWYSSDFYSGTEPVRVTLDGLADDGMAGEADNVQTENVRGSERDDILIGDGGPNHLDGGSGADELHGGGGDDFVDGGVDADRVYGEGGADKVYGGDSADDVVDGGPGADEILGDGICFYTGCNTGGNDTIRARDGEIDTIDCGGGYDRGDADALDHVTGRSCEALAIAAAPAPAAATRPPAPDVRAPGRISRRELMRRGIAVRVRCATACAVDARLLVGRRSAGHAATALAGAGTAQLRVKPSHRRVKRASRLTLRVTVVQGQTTATRSLRVRIGGAAHATALAAAVRPKPGFYLELKPSTKTPETLVSFSLKGSKLYDFAHFDTCVREELTAPVATRVRRGRFSFHSSVKAVNAAGRYDVRFDGVFSSATAAKGTASFTKTKGDVAGPAGCHSSIRFHVTRDGPARPPNGGG